MGITVPITTLCPCSKEISQVGAHNQRGEVRVQVRYRKFFWIEDLIRLVEESASCEVYALLKRQDEKFVTEKAYSNPMFVEDVVREIAHRLEPESTTSPGTRWNRKTSSPSTTIRPTPISNRNRDSLTGWAAFSTPGFRRLSFFVFKKPCLALP